MQCDIIAVSSTSGIHSLKVNHVIVSILGDFYEFMICLQIVLNENDVKLCMNMRVSTIFCFIKHDHVRA